MASENSSEEDSTKFCDSCTFRGLQDQAITRCDECAENLCESCGEIHRSFKATRDHVLKPFINVATSKRKPSPPFMLCEEHNSETLTLYCTDHKKVCCSLCKLTIHRKCTMTTFYEKADEQESKNEATKFLERLNKLISEFDKVVKSRENHKSKVECCSIRVRAEVERFKVGILNWLDKLETKIEEELIEKERKLIDDIDNHIKKSDQVMKQLNEVLSSYEKVGEKYQTMYFTLMMKNKEKAGHWETIKDQLFQEVEPITFAFQKSNEIVNMITKFYNLGKIFENPNLPVIDINFLNISSVAKRTDITVLSQRVTGLAVTSDGKVVICHGFDRLLKVLSSQLTVRDELKLDHKIWDVAAYIHDNVVVTGRESKRLYFFDISSGIVKTKSVDMGKDCWGIAYKNEKFYVSIYEGDRKEVRVITLDGKTTHNFKISQGFPYYLAISNISDRIITSTGNASIVLCTDLTGYSLFTYSDSQLNSALGLLVDTEDNFLVCGWKSNNVHVVKNDGSKDIILLTSGDGVNQPICLAYRPSDKTLFVGVREKPYLLAFTVNLK